jgi:hypothetical protein
MSELDDPWLYTVGGTSVTVVRFSVTMQLTRWNLSESSEVAITGSLARRRAAAVPATFRSGNIIRI